MTNYSSWWGWAGTEALSLGPEFAPSAYGEDAVCNVFGGKLQAQQIKAQLSAGATQKGSKMNVA